MLALSALAASKAPSAGEADLTCTIESPAGLAARLTVMTEEVETVVAVDRLLSYVESELVARDI